MLRIKNISAVCLLLLLFACIKPYSPKIDSNVANKYVVSGRITDKEGWQAVEVSMSSSIGAPQYIPVQRCQVRILDDQGNVFSLNEVSPGHYQGWIGQEFLIHGHSYRVKVAMLSGEVLTSAFDKMPSGPLIDSVYYSVEDLPTSDPGKFSRVMQFYVDLKANTENSHYYKWDIWETWEYNAARPVEYYYDGSFHQVDPPDSTNKVCWITGLVKNVFTVSTMNLSQNRYTKYPLHNIDGKTSRLGILYSMLVCQYALSEDAYNYWEKLRINSNEQGGLYEKQPLAIKGNLQNLTNPGTEVLGYFYAASESTRRYFYKNIPGINLDFNNNCSESHLGRFGWKEFTKDDYPVYYYFNAHVLTLLSTECVDCRLMGGTTVKPDFWPN